MVFYLNYSARQLVPNNVTQDCFHGQITYKPSHHISSKSTGLEEEKHSPLKV